MAKNQELLQALQNLQRSDQAETRGSQKTALEALMKLNLSEGAASENFKGVVVDAHDVFEVNFDGDGLEPHGVGDNAANNNLRALQRLVAEKRVMFGLRELELDDLKEIVAKDDNGELRTLLADQRDSFGNLGDSYHWLGVEEADGVERDEPILTDKALGRIKDEARILVVNKRLEGFNDVDDVDDVDELLRRMKDIFEALDKMQEPQKTTAKGAVKGQSAKLLEVINATEQITLPAPMPEDASDLEQGLTALRKSMAPMELALELAKLSEVDGLTEEHKTKVNQAKRVCAEVEANFLAAKIKEGSDALITRLDGIDLTSKTQEAAQAEQTQIAEEFARLRKIYDDQLKDIPNGELFVGDANAEAKTRVSRAVERAKENWEVLQQKVNALNQAVAKQFAPEANILLEEDSLLDFTDEVVHEGETFYEAGTTPLPEPQGPTSLSTSRASAPKYKGVDLKEGEFIRSMVVFPRVSGSPSQVIGLLKQDHTGKVTDMSRGRLSSEEQSRVALKQAQMLLANYKPEQGDILIRGNNPVMANKVYAALLLLKDSHLELKDIKIKSLVDGCTGPGRLTRNRSFINEHLQGVSGALQQETASVMEKTQTMKQFLREKRQDLKADEDLKTKKEEVEQRSNTTSP